MNKKTGFILLFLMSYAAASAQLKGFSVGPYFEAAWPKGEMAAQNKNGIGVGLAADLKLGKRMAATGSIGYLHFGRKTVNANTPSTAINAVPVRAGLKYRLPLVYLKLESGVARLSNQSEAPLILSPGLGIRLLGLDVQGSYETWLGENGRSFATLKIGYHF